jgi:hypothetical protein
MTQRLKFYALGVVGELAQSQGNCSLAARKNASTTASAYSRNKIDFDIARATQTEITSLGQRPKKELLEPGGSQPITRIIGWRVIR